MFLALEPTAAVITSVEWDHPDCYPTPASFRAAFMQFADAVKAEGLIVSCLDDEGAEQVRSRGAARRPRWMTYGLAAQADIQAVHLEARPGRGYAGDLLWWHAPAGKLELEVPGVHNVHNALAALAVACWCDVPTAQALASLAAYRGAARRFELKGEVAGVTVIDDYAHHPTAIAATLAAARRRYPDRRLWAVFQPHTFSRTERMIYRMGESFGDADHVIVTDIYAAREADDGRVSAAELVAASPHRDIRHIGDLATAAGYLTEHVEPGAVVITLGAGDSHKVGELLLAALAERTEQDQ
jgi:UDP-N-acetylmuramate--alanine ligase